MVVSDFDVVSVVAVPAEAEAVLVVDPDGVLAGAIGFEWVELVIGRDAEVGERLGGVELATIRSASELAAYKSLSVTAPSEAVLTSLAYLARTPRVSLGVKGLRADMRAA